MAGGPWGSGPKDQSSGQGGDHGGDDGPRQPWQMPPAGKRHRHPAGQGGSSALDQLIHWLRDRLGGGGGGGHQGPGMVGGQPLWLWAIAAILLSWILLTSVHRIGPQERGILTRFGSYVGTMKPGINLSFPAPIDSVEKLDVEEIRTIDIGGSGDSERLILTGDQNIVDLAYSVRWNIRDPELFQFALAEPETTISEVSESAMRAVISSVTLDQAMGAQRGQIEQEVASMMQAILDNYKSGIRVQGIAIKQADPPAKTIEAFKDVSAAQQEAQSSVNRANAYAQQVTARAQGEAAAFDKVYAQYRLAPEVTRKRMYYDTMEAVLSKTDKIVVEANNVTTYLPLPELGKRARPATGTEVVR
ncbi:protease modulator HflK [Aquisediminimonas sediminicola]|uniref:protease modulator HflK n=1 Tax=Alteraquisediminimonas sediminicola TaxID=2676787 RepID=UPI001C8DCD0B|nr:protease modulator HflK [Aquisediminimonas sediminicola]